MPRRFVVVGAGGVGGHLLRGLAPMLEFKDPGSMLCIVDGDNFEAKNRERQDFEEMGNKAQVRARELMNLYPQTFFIPYPSWLVDTIPEGQEAEDGEEEGGGFIAVRDLLQEGDVVYSVVDNFAARKVLFDAAREYSNIDVFTGGNDDRLFGSVYHYQRRDGADVTDHPAEYYDELVNPPDRNPGELSCAERAAIEGGTQLLATNMGVAAWLLGLTQLHIIEGVSPTDTYNDGMFDFAVGLAQGSRRLPDPVPVASATATRG